MKNILLTAAVGLIALTLNANNNPTTHVAPKSNYNSFFENAVVDFLVDDSALLESLALVSYNDTNDYFSLKTMKDVTYIQILNETGELEYQLPIENSLVHLAMKDFIKGDYYVNIKFEGQVDYLTTMLTKK